MSFPLVGLEQIFIPARAKLNPVSSPQKHRTLGFLAAFLASSFWGCGFYFGKIALAEMSVGSMVFYRFFFATLGLLPLLITHRPKFNASEWRTLLLASFLGVPLQFILQFKGLSLTTVSHAALMVGTMPVILAVGATIFAKERLSKLGWAALTLSTTGAALIALGGTHHHTTGGPTLAGDLLVVVSLGIALFWILFNQRLMQLHSHIVVTAYGIAAGTLMLALYVPLAYGPPPLHGISLRAWLALIASGLLCTATTTLLWNWGMTQVPASQAGILLNMEPLIGSLLGVFLLSEHLGPLAWLGGAMILTAAISLTTNPSTALEDPAMV
jgi:drug/metabolite transporter (DMT)-like permease